RPVSAASRSRSTSCARARPAEHGFGTESGRQGCTGVGPTLTAAARPATAEAETGRACGPTSPAPEQPARGGPRWDGAAFTAAIVAAGLVVWAVAFDPAGLQPFTTRRAPVLGITVLLAAAVGWRARPPLPAALRALGLALLAWLALATVVSVDP